MHVEEIDSQARKQQTNVQRQRDIHVWWDKHADRERWMWLLGRQRQGKNEMQNYADRQQVRETYRQEGTEIDRQPRDSQTDIHTEGPGDRQSRRQ